MADTLLFVTGIQERRRALTKGERTRERLLRAGVDRFGTYGYRATSVSQLSRDAGLTPAAAYAYFADKEAYWQAAVVADLDALRAEIATQVTHSARPVVDSMMAMIEGLQVHPLARRVMVEGSPPDLMMVLSHPLFASTTRLIADVLAARQAAGTLPVDATAEKLAVDRIRAANSLLTPRGIRQLRDSLGLTVAQFSELCYGTPKGIVEGWEKGRYFKTAPPMR